MTDAKPCMFCFMDRGGRIKRSAEHFLSRPVASAFSIDRDGGEVFRFSVGDNDAQVVRLNGLKRKAVCRDCNSGWMNQLEHAMVGVSEWFASGDAPLGEGLNLALRKWTLTRHLLLTQIDGNAAEFGDTDALIDDYVVPPASHARAVYENNLEVILGTPLALSRSSAGLEFAWAFGHPAVSPRDRPQLGRFAPTSVLTLREFQVWVTTPMIFDYDVHMPSGLKRCTPELRARELVARPGIPTAGDVTVTFSGIDEVAAAFEQIARMSEAEIRALSHEDG